MRRVIALGFFDGIHLGHQALLHRAVERSWERGMVPAMFTFDRIPRELVTGLPVPLLTTAEERRWAVRELFPGMEVLMVPFDRAMMTMPWEDFVTLLLEEYHAGWLVAGYDFHFGHQNTGTADGLKKRAELLGMGCDVVTAVTLDGKTVSSTHIRSLLERGETEEAARFLGRPFSVSGVVRRGKHIG
ncbi:MAG: riboflavin biosynthesis protein RibF, partial [Oscillospiraceae bacterium]|nr:riboflavin biosynthesis protein RibF [Oscillospiraceae bacterium]